MVTNRRSHTKHNDQTFAALADQTRRSIVQQLAEAPRPVHEIAATFDISRPAVSRHLRVLKEAGVVGLASEGRQNVYFLKTGALKEIEDWLNELWAGRMAKLKRMVEEAPDD